MKLPTYTRDQQEHDAKVRLSILSPSPEKLKAEITQLKKTDLSQGGKIDHVVYIFTDLKQVDLRDDSTMVGGLGCVWLHNTCLYDP